MFTVTLRYIDIEDNDSVNAIVKAAKPPQYKEWLATQTDHKDHDIYFELRFGYETVDVTFE